MARYYDNFTAYGTGSWTTNTNWQRRIVATSTTTSFPTDVDGIAGRVLTLTGATNNGSRVLSYNPAGSTINADILVRFETTTANNTTGGRRGMAYVRYAGTTEATTVGYSFYTGTFGGARAVGIVEDSTGVTVSSAAHSTGANTWYWVRLQASGSTIRGKIWSGAVTSEPAGWTVSGTNSTKATAGYHGVGTFNTGTVRYGWFGIGTNGDVPPEPHVLTTKTIAGNVRIKQVVDANIDGNVSIERTTDNDITGNIRVGKIRVKDQQGNIRVKKSVSKAQSGNVRIQKSATKTQTGNTRIEKAVDRNQTGTFWIGSPPTVREQIGNVNVTKNVNKHILGRIRIERERLKDQLGEVRVETQEEHSQTGNVSIFKTVDRTQVGQVNIERTMRKNILGRIRVERIESETISGNFRIEKVIDKTAVGNVRVERTETKPQTGQVRVEHTRTKNITGNFRIETINPKTITGNVRVEISTSKPQVGNVTIIQEAFHPQVGNVRIYDANTLPAVYIKSGNYGVDRNLSQGDFGTDTIEGGNYGPSKISTGTYGVEDIDETGNYGV